MSEWRKIRLNDLVEEIIDRRGVTPLKLGSNFTTSGYRVISAKLVKNNRIDLSSDVARYVDRSTYLKWMKTPLKSDDVILTSEAPIGETAYLREDAEWCLGQRLFCIRTKKEIMNGRFLFYCLQYENTRHELLSRATGTTAQGISQESLRQALIPIPPLPEQKAIAHILGSLDDKIELNRRMNETLEAMARAIFKDWFVDFGPTRAKIEGRAPYLPEPIWSLFPDAIDPLSGLPIGWKLGNLGSISESVNRIVNPVEIDAQTPYIGLEHIPRCSISLSNWGSAGKVTSNKLRFEKREFLFGKLRPYFHKVGIAPISGICSTDIVVIRAKSEIWSSFVLEVISSDDFIEYTNLTSTGTKMPRTSWIIMGKYELALPSEAFVKHFNLTIQPCMSQIIDNIHQSRTLAELRDRLLPKLMSGQIRVKDAEKLVEEVL